MNLFQSEWLREPPRPVAGSYARPAYRARYARTNAVTAAEPEPIAIDLLSLAVPSPPPAPRRRPAASFDRAA